MRQKRVVLGIALIAALLVVGKVTSLIYTDYKWYQALGASEVWALKFKAQALLYCGLTIVAALFSFLNILAVRRSILFLLLPKQVGDLTFNERIVPARLLQIAALISVMITTLSVASVRNWPVALQVLIGVKFNEIDPYTGHDISTFVSLFPLETMLYNWSIVLVSIVTTIVVTLYALTPSINWGRDGLQITSYARRHLIVLGAVVIAILGWGLRLSQFELLIDGNGPNGLVTPIDHSWLIPALRIASVGAFAASVAVLFAGWIRQLQTVLIIVSSVALMVLATHVVIPFISSKSYSDNVAGNKDSELLPYQETRNIYTKRAFPVEGQSLSTKHELDSTRLTEAFLTVLERGDTFAVYPEATGIRLSNDSSVSSVSPIATNFFSKLAFAWSSQNMSVLTQQSAKPPGILMVRDLRDRIKKLTPIFAQSKSIGVISGANGFLWIVDLYSTSQTYPLSESMASGDVEVNYRRHVATAYVDGISGRSWIVPDTALDPIARSWFKSAAGAYSSESPDLSFYEQQFTINKDKEEREKFNNPEFRDRIIHLYGKIRTSLRNGDFGSFGSALDSLGIELGVPK